MNFYNPNVVFEGIVQLQSTPSQANHAVRKDWVESNAIMAIHTDSSLLAETVVVDGSKQLKLKSLAVTDVNVDSTATSLANWISSNYSNGDEVQEGDIVILTNTSSSRTETYIHNGGSAGTSADFTQIEGSDVSSSEVRSLLSASSGVSYNSSTGAFTANQGEIRGFFSAGTGLSYDDANGTYSLNANSDGINEGSSNLYFTQDRARGAISVSGGGLSYNSSTGVITASIGSDDVTEETNLFFTQARSRAAVGLNTVGSEDVQLLTYNNSTGAFSLPLSRVFNQFSAGDGLAFDGGEYSLSANTDDVPEATNPTNKYFTDARARGAISVDAAGLAYNSGTGQISLTADTDDISEGATNQYFTDSRARSAISLDSSIQNQLLNYNSSTGEMSVDMNKFRKEFANQSLTANTFATLNHGLGRKYVHVSAYDSNDNLVMLDVQLTDANNLKVKAGSNKTGLKIVISI